MQWHRMPDGVLQTQARGLSFELDPCRKNLHISVVDYHARPLDLSVTELQSLVSVPTDGSEPHPLVIEDRRTRVLRFLRRCAPAFLVGAVVGVMVQHVRTRRSR